jgi:anthranilate/para-aminobenzoate synthase component II
MAARWRGKAALGFYFHPESVLTARGTDITRAAVTDLIHNQK